MTILDQPPSGASLRPASAQLGARGPVPEQGRDLVPLEAGVGQFFLQSPVAVRVAVTAAAVTYPPGKLFPGGSIEAARVLPDFLFQPRAKLGVGQITAGVADDAAFGVQVVLQVQFIKCGQQFACCQVAGDA